MTNDAVGATDPFDRKDSRGAGAKALLRALLGFVVFPNLLFLSLGAFLYTTRPLVNIDYALLGAGWLWLPVWLRIAGFAVLFIVDGISSTAAMYNINPVAGVVALIRAPIGLIGTVILGLSIAVALAVGIGIFVVRFLRDRRRRYPVLALMLGVIILAFATRVGAGSSAGRFITEIVERDRSSRGPSFRMAAASDSLRADVQRGSLGEYNILLVSVESLGVLADSALSAFVWAPFDNEAVRARYTLRRGDVAFRGGTTSGELRELCGMYADYITLQTGLLPDCLPRQLRERGYATFGVHGYDPQYYDRDTWYPLLFDSLAMEDRMMELAGDRRCGTQFRGICDRDAFVLVEQFVRGGGRRFVYWMTLDAHTPVDVERRSEFDAEWQRAGLSELEICRQAPEVCLQALFWHDMNTRLAGLALADVPVRMLIVGDHAPAFVRRTRGGAFVRGRVPYLELVPAGPAGRTSNRTLPSACARTCTASRNAYTPMTSTS